LRLYGLRHVQVDLVSSCGGTGCADRYVAGCSPREQLAAHMSRTAFWHNLLNPLPKSALKSAG